MENEESYLKKKVCISIIAGFAAVCLCLTALVSCSVTPKMNQASDLQTSGLQDSDVSETAPDPSATVTAEEQMAEGKVYAPQPEYAQNQADQITKWYCKNILNRDFADCVDYFADLRSIACFENHQLQYAIYKLKDDGNAESKYLYILYVNEYDNKKNVLIDGMTTSEIIPYPVDRVKEKLSSHALYSKYAMYLTDPVFTEGMYQLDIASLIGKNRHIHLSSFINSHEIAVLSSKMDLLEYYNPIYSDWKLDFIDIANGQHTKERKLQEMDGVHLDYISFFSNNEYFIIYFTAKTSDDMDYVKYKINLSDNTEEIERYDREEYEKKDVRSDEKIGSGSGRYYAFYKDYDLYVHNNETKKDILLYDGYIDVDNYGIDSVVPSVSFFDGDTLFFNI